MEYETVEGWKEEIGQAKKFGDLPDNAKRYIDLIEKTISKPITIIGVGPKRTQTIFR